MTALPIPLVALEDCGAILGRRGAGKSGTGRFLFEHELAAGRRCCAIDPKGDWWGIRMDKTGGASGFDIPVFGGSHGDLALTEDMGEMLGRLIATHDLSCVVDLSAFPSQAAQRRFARDFAEALYEHNRQPLTLFLDEADQLAPQRVPAEMARLLHAMETLIRLGRQRGIFMWMLTQRPQILNKNLLSQAESLVAMKVTTPHDRKAIRDWMDAHDPEQAEAVSKQLAKLEVGEAFVWVPVADFLERVRFPIFRTYDSGRTPRHGETVQAVTLPTIDLSAIEAAIASSGAPPKGTIPSEPRDAERIAQLEDLLSRASSERDELAAAHAALEQECDRWCAGVAAIERLVFTIQQGRFEPQAKAGADAVAPEAKKGVAAEPVSRPGAGRSAPATAEPRAVTGGETPPAPPASSPDEAAAGETAALTPTAAAIAALLRSAAPDGIAFDDALLLLGRRPGSGDAGKARALLIDNGLMSAAGGICTATPALNARNDLGFAHYPAATELVDLWARKLRGPGGDVLRNLFEQGPASRDQVAARLGKSPTSGWFGKGMKDLRRSRLIVEQAGTLYLHDFLRDDE